jgi:HAD superfamily hydrolase (TIGR01509 family)
MEKMKKSKKIKAVIFDFNGTLFWDTKLHDDAWDMFLLNKGVHLSKQEKQDQIHGRHNEDILNNIFPGKLTKNDIEVYSIEKERIYREICKKTDMKLIDGAETFFDFLQSENMPFTIATGSEKENVGFYFEHFKLSRYFDYSKVVFNNGKVKGKPHPEIFELAMNNLGIKNFETLIFEDSEPGITAAERAGAGKIIIVDSNQNDLSKWDYQKIKSFRELNDFIY